MSRVLVSEDDDYRIYDVYDAGGELVGQDVESKEVETRCPTCGS